jgi:hypothetical protein
LKTHVPDTTQKTFFLPCSLTTQQTPRYRPVAWNWWISGGTCAGHITNDPVDGTPPRLKGSLLSLAALTESRQALPAPASPARWSFRESQGSTQGRTYVQALRIAGVFGPGGCRRHARCLLGGINFPIGVSRIQMSGWFLQPPGQQSIATTLALSKRRWSSQDPPGAGFNDFLGL